MSAKMPYSSMHGYAISRRWSCICNTCTNILAADHVHQKMLSPVSTDPTTPLERIREKRVNWCETRAAPRASRGSQRLALELHKQLGMSVQSPAYMYVQSRRCICCTTIQNLFPLSPWFLYQIWHTIATTLFPLSSVSIVLY